MWVSKTSKKSGLRRRGMRSEGIGSSENISLFACNDILKLTGYRCDTLCARARCTQILPTIPIKACEPDVSIHDDDEKKHHMKLIGLAT